MTQRKCGVCGELGHNARSHSDEDRYQWLTNQRIAERESDALLERLATEPSELPEDHRSPAQLALAEAVHGEDVQLDPLPPKWSAPQPESGWSTAPLPDPAPYEWAWPWPVGWDAEWTSEIGAFVIRWPGVYQLDSDLYHADPTVRGSMSNSDGLAISLPGCPAQFRYDRDHQVHKTSAAFDFGHVAHREVLGAGEPVAVFPKHDARTKEGKAIRADWDAARAAGVTPITEPDYDVVLGMVAALKAHPFASRLLAQPGKTEQALFWIDEETGVWRRSLIDFLPDPPAPGRTMILVDYKTAEDVAPGFDMMRKIYDYGYHRQGATYLDGVLALGLADDARIVFINQCKRPPFLVTPVELDAESLRIGRIENRRALRVFAECQASGVWPEYTDGVVTSGVPPYIEREYDGVFR